MRILCFALAVWVSGCVVNATIRSPSPNVLLSPKFTGKYSIEIEGKTEPKICSSANGVKDFCIAGLRNGFQGGLDSVLERAMKPGGDTYRSVLRVVELQHSIDSVSDKAGAVKIALKWQFELFDPQGNPVVQLAERTEGPEKLTDIFNTDSAADALVSAVLERVAAAINEAAAPPVTQAAGGAPVAVPASVSPEGTGATSEL